MGKRRTTKRGGSYTTNVTQSYGGFPQIDSNRGEACGASATRGGNNVTGGRRRRRTKGGRRHRKTRRGGGHDLALNVPRAGYGFFGKGAAGIPDATPIY
jgi:hypothetical protein